MPSYFASFRGFVQNLDNDFMTEFNRLAKHRHWRKGGKKYRHEYNRAVENEFERFYASSDASKLAKWQELCTELSIDSVPRSIKQCKQALHRVHINLVDLIDSRRHGLTLFEGPRFRNAAALSAYTRKTGRFFPKDLAKEDGFISALLRHIQ